MCEYLAGAFRSERLATEASRHEARAIAEKAGYHIQIDSEIPQSIRNEIARYIPDSQGVTFFNLTSGRNWNCIDETLDAELEYLRKKPLDNVPFFAFIRSLFEFVKPETWRVIYTEGAETGWFPLQQRATSIAEFLSLLYEHRDRADCDVGGVYSISKDSRKIREQRIS